LMLTETLKGEPSEIEEGAMFCDGGALLGLGENETDSTSPAKVVNELDRGHVAKRTARNFDSKGAEVGETS